MKTFILLMTFFGTDAEVTYVKTDLTGAVCIEALTALEWYADDMNGVLSCELYHGPEWIEEVGIKYLYSK